MAGDMLQVLEKKLLNPETAKKKTATAQKVFASTKVALAVG